MELKDKVGIITGARRIGQTVAEELAKKGVHLAITYKSSKEESEAVCKACIGLGVKAAPFMADLSQEDDIANLVAQVEKDFGRIDILVHMAAPYPRTPLETVTMEEYIQIQEAIGGSALMLAKYVIPVMLKNEGDVTAFDPPGRIKGKIIFISDWSVLNRPYPEFPAYNMAKGGINVLTINLAGQFAPEITVNAIAPGPMLKPEGLSEEENKEALSKTPLKGWGGALPIAQGVSFFMDNDFVTGVILPIDGGRSIG